MKIKVSPVAGGMGPEKEMGYPAIALLDMEPSPALEIVLLLKSTRLSRQQLQNDTWEGDGFPSTPLLGEGCMQKEVRVQERSVVSAGASSRSSWKAWNPEHWVMAGCSEERESSRAAEDARSERRGLVWGSSQKSLPITSVFSMNYSLRPLERKWVPCE